MALPDDELRKFQFVILCLNLGDEIPQINNLFRNNHIDHIVLQQVEAVLTRTQRHGVLQLLRETLSGKIKKVHGYSLFRANRVHDGMQAMPSKNFGCIAQNYWT